MTTALVEAYLDRYYKTFGDIFPTEQLSTLEGNELIMAIIKCLDQKKSASIVFGLDNDKTY